MRDEEAGVIQNCVLTASICVNYYNEYIQAKQAAYSTKTRHILCYSAKLLDEK